MRRVSGYGRKHMQSKCSPAILVLVEDRSDIPSVRPTDTGKNFAEYTCQKASSILQFVQVDQYTNKY